MELFRVFGRIGIEGRDAALNAIGDVDNAASGAELDADGEVSVHGADDAVAGYEGVEAAAQGDFDAYGEVRIDGVQDAKSSLAALQDRMGSLGSAAQSLGGKLSKWVSAPMAGAVGGALAFVNSQAQAADAIEDATAATGMSADEIQRWRQEADMAGVQSQAMEQAAGRLNRRMDQIREGTSRAGEAFQQLGIDMDAFDAANMDGRMRMVMRALSDIDDQAQRVEIGEQLFGRRFEQIAPMLRQTGDEMEATLDGHEPIFDEEQRANLDEFRRAMVELGHEIRRVGVEVAGDLADPLRDFARWLSRDGVGTLRRFGQTIGAVVSAFGALPGPVQGVIAVLGGLLAAAGPLLMSFALLPAAIGGITTAFATLTPMVGAAVAAITPFIPLVAGVAAAVTAAIVIFRNWENIIEALGDAWGWLRERISDAWEWIRGIPGRIADPFAAMASDVMGVWRGWISDMRDAIVDFVLWLPRKIREGVDNAIRAFRDLARTVVGNSIIPDMVDDVGGEMTRMSEDMMGESARASRGVSGNLDSITPERAGMRGGSGGGTQKQTIDMRHSVIRDEKDLVKRARMAGAEVGL